MTHHLYDRCVLKTYEDTQRWFARAKSKDKGRPFNGWAKVKHDGGCYQVYVYDRLICTITPENILRMEITGTEGRAISNTLSSSINRLVPIVWTRVGMGRYRILGLRTLRKADSWWVKAKEAPELFKGLEFDLTTGEALNAKADLVKRVDKDARLEWVRCLRRFKRGVQLRAKMGVFDTIQTDLNAGSKFRSVNGKIFANRTPDWGDEKWMNLLYTSIRDDLYPKELLAGFLLAAPSVLWNRRTGTTAERMGQVATSVINSHSVELRTRFGVFADEVTDNGKEQD